MIFNNKNNTKCRYWSILPSWYKFLADLLPFPQEQLSTDDFDGVLYNATNLAIKVTTQTGRIRAMDDRKKKGGDTDRNKKGDQGDTDRKKKGDGRQEE